jgi:general stress protein YciG
MADGNGTSKRGFASMSPEKQREIASKGGKSVPSIGVRSRRTETWRHKQVAKADRCLAPAVSDDHTHGLKDGGGSFDGTQVTP